MRVIVLLSLLVFTLVSCDYWDDRLKIVNKLDQDFYLIDYDTTSLNNYQNKVLTLDPISPDTLKRMFQINTTWEYTIRSARNKKLNLFILDVDTVKHYSRDNIIKNKRYLKILSYSLSEIKGMDWTIVLDSNSLGYK